MKKNSLIKKYFAVCSFCVISSILILGVVLVVFASRYFERDKYSLLERNARQAASVTANNYVSNGDGLINKSVISLAYSILSRSVDAQFFLMDLNGSLLFADEEDLSGYNLEVQVSPAVIQQILGEGIYEETGLLGGVFQTSHYSVGVPVVAEDRVIGVLFACSSADALGEFLSALIEMFLVSAVVVLLIAFILIYFITARLVKPLRDMLYAIHSFSKGDFSKRVTVSDYGEIGQLSMAFNNMASALATTESTALPWPSVCNWGG